LSCLPDIPTPCTVQDGDSFGSPHLGTASLDANMLLSHKHFSGWLPLKGRSGRQQGFGKARLRVTIAYVPVPEVGVMTYCTSLVPVWSGRIWPSTPSVVPHSKRWRLMSAFAAALAEHRAEDGPGPVGLPARVLPDAGGRARVPLFRLPPRPR